jgi:hypothetical protein
MRQTPKIGTKAPPKMGGTGGGLSKPAVAKAIASNAKAAPKAAPVRKSMLPRATDTKRNDKAMKEI